MNMQTALVMVWICILFLTVNMLFKRILSAPALVLFSWAPALTFSAMDVVFIHPNYQALNYGVDLPAYVFLNINFFFFCLGSLFLLSLYNLYPIKRANAPSEGTLSPNPERFYDLYSLPMGLLFLFSLFICLYALSKSGLSVAVGTDAKEVYDSRLAFHLGPINHFILLLDITAVFFFAKALIKQRLLYVIPFIAALFCYLLTLQKSRILFVFFSVTFVAIIYWREFVYLFLKSAVTRYSLYVVIILFIIGVALTNVARGIGITRYTTLDSVIVEQLFIYTGASAIRNLSATLSGVIQSDASTYGAIFIRSILWGSIDREILNPTRYYGGINNGTALIFYWWDLRGGAWVVSFISGFVASLFLKRAESKKFIPLVLGCVAFNYCIFSVFTDQMYEPTTLIFVFILIFSVLFSLFFRAFAKKSGLYR